MPKTEMFPTDAERVRRLLKERGIKNAEGASRRLKDLISKRTIERAMPTAGAGEASFSTLQALAGLCDVDEHELLPESATAARDAVRREARRVRRPAKPADPVRALCEELEGEAQSAISRLSDASTRTSELFNAMGRDHFFVATTVDQVPLVFQGGDHVTARAHAIERGAMFAMLVPSLVMIKSLWDRHKISVEDFSGRYESHRELVSKHISRPEAGKITRRYMRMLTCDEFPVTPAGWAISLLGIRNPPPEKPTLRVITRGPFHLAEKFVLWPSLDTPYVSALERFVEARLVHREQSLSGKAVLTEDERQEAHFIRRLKSRMNGSPEPIE